MLKNILKKIPGNFHKKMSQASQKFHRFCKHTPVQSHHLVEDLRQVRQQLDSLQSYFALESDHDLIDAAIYQREALEARQRYLLRLAKEHQLEQDPAPIPVETTTYIQ